jgi:FkbM family methyltransferase
VNTIPAVIEGALRRLARDRVIRKRLPPDLGGGAVFCSPDALLSTWKPGWRAEQTRNLFEWARRLVAPGHVVWDIGANQGLFSFAAAAAAGPTGHVIAFEPDPFLAGLLYRTRKVQPASARVDILPVAVSGNCGVEMFCVAARDRALNHLAQVVGNPDTGGVRERFAVVTVTLEWIAERLPRPDVIKVDVEGGELAMLRRVGTPLLESIRPCWIIEVATENANPIGEIFRAAGYRMFDVNAPHQEIPTPAWNTLAVPAERDVRRT